MGGTKGNRAGALKGHRSVEKGRAGKATPSERIRYLDIDYHSGVDGLEVVI